MNKIKNTISRLVMLTLLTSLLSVSYSFADFAQGNNIIPLTQVNEAAKSTAWRPLEFMYNDAGSIYYNDMNSLAPNNAVNLTMRNYNLISITNLRADITKRDIANPVFKDAYLQEMHQKGLVIFNKLNLVIKAPAYYGNCYDYQGVSMSYGLFSNGQVLGSSGMYGATPFTFSTAKQLFGSTFLSDSGLFMRGYRDTLFPATQINLQISMQNTANKEALVGISAGKFRYDSYHTTSMYVPMYIDLAASSIEVTILPDTSQVGKIYDTVQSIPTTLNNTVNQINTSLANQPLALVYIPNNAQRTSQLAKLGLATNITTDGIYKSSDGFKYKVVFYTPPSSVDQLNLT